MLSRTASLPQPSSASLPQPSSASLPQEPSLSGPLPRRMRRALTLSPPRTRFQRSRQLVSRPRSRSQRSKRLVSPTRAWSQQSQQVVSPSGPLFQRSQLHTSSPPPGSVSPPSPRSQSVSPLEPLFRLRQPRPVSPPQTNPLTLDKRLDELTKQKSKIKSEIDTAKALIKAFGDREDNPWPDWLKINNDKLKDVNREIKIINTAKQEGKNDKLAAAGTVLPISSSIEMLGLIHNNVISALYRDLTQDKSNNTKDSKILYITSQHNKEVYLPKLKDIIKDMNKNQLEETINFIKNNQKNFNFEIGIRKSNSKTPNNKDKKDKLLEFVDKMILLGDAKTNPKKLPIAAINLISEYLSNTRRSTGGRKKRRQTRKNHLR